MILKMPKNVLQVYTLMVVYVISYGIRHIPEKWNITISPLMAPIPFLIAI